MGDYRFWHGRRADVAIAVAAFAVDLADLLFRAVHDASAFRVGASAAGLTVAAVTLLVRRRRPVLTVAVAVGADVLIGLLAGPQTGFISTVSLVALYSAGRYLPLLRGWAVGVGAVALLAVPALTRTGFGAAELLCNFLVVVVGQLVAAREELTSHRRAVAVAEAVHSERRRIARELHDVVAHHIGVMSALIGAARLTMPRDPARSREALAAAERTAREAMFEMREMLAVLRTDEPGAGVELAGRLRPDVVLMDIRMPGLDGIQATRRIVDALPGVRVLALSTFDLDENVVAALRAGASGFLPLDVSPEELTEAIRVVHRGDSAVAPRLLTYLIGTFIRTSRPRHPVVPPGLAGLSARELEVLGLIARGRSNADIAGELTISDSTVKNHVTSLFRKLGIRDRAQAVIAAYEAGLVTPGVGPQE